MLTEEFIVIIKELVDKGLIDLQKLIVNVSANEQDNTLSDEDKMVVNYLNSRTVTNNNAFRAYLKNRTINDVSVSKTLDNCVKLGAFSYLTTNKKTSYYMKLTNNVTSDMIVRKR